MPVDKKLNLNCIVIGAICILMAMGIIIICLSGNDDSSSTDTFNQEGSNKENEKKPEVTNKYKSDQFNQERKDNFKKNNSTSYEKKPNTEPKGKDIDEKNSEIPLRNDTSDKNARVHESTSVEQIENHKSEESNTSQSNEIEEQIHPETNTFLNEDIPEEQINLSSNNRENSNERNPNTFTENLNRIGFENKIRMLKSNFTAARPEPEQRYTIKIDRKSILHDSYIKIMDAYPANIRSKRFFINFEDELGSDYGVITKEWLELVTKELLNIDMGLFTYSNGDHTTLRPHIKSDVSNSEHLKFFKLMGRILGIAIINECNIYACFDKPVFKYITNKKCDIEDLKDFEPSIYNSMIWIRDYATASDLEDYTFTYDIAAFDHTETIDLINNGRNISVTYENRRQYIDLVVEYILTKSIQKQLDAIKQGLFELIDENLISQFTEAELELLVCGITKIDVEDWKRNTVYDKCSEDHFAVLWFWKAVNEFDDDERSKLLKFCTGTSRLPYGGFANLQGNIRDQKFRISFIQGKSEKLPTAHTCSNTLDLYEYSSYQILKDKLLYAISQQSEGFGFE